MTLAALSRRTAAAIAAVGLMCGLSSCSSEDTTTPTATATTTVDDAAVNDARYQCLLDEGFAVTRGDDGSVNFQDDDSARQTDYQNALSECNAQLQSQGLLPADSTASLQRDYASLTQLHDCLVAAGFPLTDWPSEQVYVDADGAFNVLDATSPVSLDEAQNACPDDFTALN